MRPKPQKPGPGQESVSDSPPPPRLEPFHGSITIEFGGRLIASATDGWRVLETSHPPTYYLPQDAFAPGVLRDASGSSWCEWKGQARYYDLVTDTKVAPAAAWTYPRPSPGFAPIAGAIAVMAAAVDRCTVNGEQVLAARWLLRRLDHQLDRRPVQRHPRLDGLVKVGPTRATISQLSWQRFSSRVVEIQGRRRRRGESRPDQWQIRASVPK